ncbi:MAG: hypothetical protein M0T75_03690 [Chloroflexi bacterium]|nr:hypothetical protein [Chloroflexota bacterium]
MYSRFKGLGLFLIVAGLVFVGVSGYTYLKTQEGARSLQAFSAAQDVKLSYDEQGQLTDRGTVEGAQAIMSLLTKDWGYTVNAGELNPNDPVVNTASEYMYQMATIAFHTLNGTQKVTLTQPAEYNGKTYAAGTYDVPVAGRYWSQFNRLDPLDGKAREQAWTGTAHALIAELGVGSVTASALQIGLGVAAIAFLLGLVLIVAGAGLVWAARPATATAAERVRAAAPAAA